MYFDIIVILDCFYNFIYGVLEMGKFRMEVLFSKVFLVWYKLNFLKWDFFI